MHKGEKDDEQYGRRSDDLIEAQTPMGWKFRARGSLVIIILLAGALGYFLWRHDETSKDQGAATIQAIQEMAFVLTLTEEERKALQLTMPASMRERMRRQQRDLREAEYRRGDQ